jgi:hypothetical protein
MKVLGCMSFRKALQCAGCSDWCWWVHLWVVAVWRWVPEGQSVIPGGLEINENLFNGLVVSFRWLVHYLLPAGSRLSS